jgi:hypothetical protein
MEPSEGKFIQFPLSAMSIGVDERERVFRLVAYSMVRAGRAAVENMDEHVKQGRFSDIEFRDDNPTDFKGTEDYEYFIVIGSEIIGLKPQTIRYVVEKHNEVERARQKFQAQFGIDPEVRIRSDIIRSVISGELKYNHFAVLVAVYSILGKKKHAEITRHKIRRRAMGYKSLEAFTDAVVKGETKTPPLTPKQIRIALDTLEERGFFVRVHPSRRRSFFSNRLTRAQLSDEVKTLIVNQSAKFQAEKNQTNRDLRQAIKQETAQLLLNARRTSIL